MNRKQSISDAAESLFAVRGYEQTSTQLIAKEAGVSEALIFKHFGSKEKLLETLIRNGYRRIVEQSRGMLQYDENPLAFVRSLLDLPARLVAGEPRFWGMQYRLIDMPISLNEHQRFLQPVHGVLVKAFRALGYRNAVEETDLLLLLIDALWKQEIVQGTGSTKALSELMKEKYSDQKAASRS
jgi:AcrR family transcriptional regulator